MAKRVKGEEDEEDLKCASSMSETFERTAGEELDTELLQKHSNLKPSSMSFKAPVDQDKSMNDRDPYFKNDVSMKS
jgi:hypothetical protein